MSGSDPAVAAVLGSIREAIVTVTGSSLVGLYLIGSLAARLRRMHADLAQANPRWDDRIEVVYISARGLAACRTRTTTIAVISSGQPFEVIPAEPDWVLTWYPARRHGRRLLGPPIDSLIPPIPTADYIEQARRSLARCTHRIPDDASPGSQAYAILTMCRGLYAIRYGELRSKPAAAAWAQQELPRWADLIGRALDWRQRQHDPGSRWRDRTQPAGRDGPAVTIR